MRAIEVFNLVRSYYELGLIPEDEYNEEVEFYKDFVIDCIQDDPINPFTKGRAISSNERRELYNWIADDNEKHDDPTSWFSRDHEDDDFEKRTAAKSSAITNHPWRQELAEILYGRYRSLKMHSMDNIIILKLLKRYSLHTYFPTVRYFDHLTYYMITDDNIEEKISPHLPPSPHSGVNQPSLNHADHHSRISLDHTSPVDLKLVQDLQQEMLHNHIEAGLAEQRNDHRMAGHHRGKAAQIESKLRGMGH